MLISIIIGVLALIISALYHKYSDYDDWKDAIVSGFAVGIFVFILVSFVIAVISSGIVSANIDDYICTTEIIYEKQIRTLQDNTNNIKSNFILGSGGVESKSKYYFYVVDSDSSYYLSSINTENCKIIETDSKTPSVVKYTKSVDWDKNELTPYLYKVPCTNEYYSIYVPKNTIVINYNLDAQ